MPTPSDFKPDFNWIDRPAGDSAVLPAMADETDSASDGRKDRPGEETVVPGTDTIHEVLSGDRVEPASPSPSESNIQDIEISDASILEDDALTVKPPAGETSDVIFRNELPNEWGHEDFAASDDDEADTFHEAFSPSASAPPNDMPRGFDLETPPTAGEFAAALSTGAVVSGESQSIPSRLVTPKDTSPEHASSSGRVLLISYASAITLVCLYLLLQLRREFLPHQLESLPDVPPMQEGQTQFYPVDAILPNGHLLTLGQSRRFGDILVEPLRVTYGPLEYEHWSGEGTRTRPPSQQSAVKLWLKFTNMSEETPIAPFDARLILESRFHEGRMLTNSFLLRSGTDDIELMHDLPPASEWELHGQHLGKVLEPGESIETYAATDFEHLPDVVGNVGSDEYELVWRLHLRKGFGPAGDGVTTLVDVAFNSKAIEEDG